MQLLQLWRGGSCAVAMFAVCFALARLVTRSLELQFSVQNLLNTNNFENLSAPNAGVALTAEMNAGQTSYPSTLIPLVLRS